MNIKTTHEIKLEDSRLREFHLNNMSAETRDIFNDFRNTEWIRLNDVKKLIFHLKTMATCDSTTLNMVEKGLTED